MRRLNDYKIKPYNDYYIVWQAVELKGVVAHCILKFSGTMQQCEKKIEELREAWATTKK